MKFEQDFKDAISQLKPAEKDKLILRLLRHDQILADRLHFELVGTQSVEERREELEAIVKERVRHMSDRFYSVGYLTMELRSLSGDITEHVKITKDKIGEISLNLLMLNETLRRNTSRIEHARLVKAHTLCIYIVARTFKLLVLLQALHEDYLADFREDLEQLGEAMGKSGNLMRTAINNGLDVNWLLSGDFPENMKGRQTELRKQGFLK